MGYISVVACPQCQIPAVGGLISGSRSGVLSMPGSELSFITGCKWKVVPEAAASSPALSKKMSFLIWEKKKFFFCSAFCSPGIL